MVYGAEILCNHRYIASSRMARLDPHIRGPVQRSWILAKLNVNIFTVHVKTNEDLPIEGQRGGSKMVGGEAARRHVEGMRRLDTPPSPPAVEQRTAGRRRLQLRGGLLTGPGAPILRREKILKKRSSILPSETKGVTVLDQGGQDMSLEGTCFFPRQGSMGEAVQNSPEKISCEQLPYCGDL